MATNTTCRSRGFALWVVTWFVTLPVVPAVVWWLLYKRFARPGRLWAKE